MSLETEGRINELRARIAHLENLVAELERRIEIMEARRGPGRPPNSTKAA